jgi:predicted nucleic acid binding AN1-type Zn finger protein
MKYLLIIWLSILNLQNTYTQQRLQDLENDITDPKDTDVERFNRDNKIYKSNKEFIFDYRVFKGSDTLICQFSKQKYGIPNWQLVKLDNKHTYTVFSIGIAILPYYVNDTQTGMTIKYYNKEGKIVEGFETTGLIENDKNTWLHPPRAQFFAITEFNSFPFIKTPYTIGRKWKSGLTAGYFASYERFGLKWEGILNTQEELEIIGKVELKTPFGQLPCFVVQGISKSNLTESKSLFYFNETYGFVKIVYDLIDKSRLELNLIDVR